MEHTTTRARIGLFATGLDTYWNQFEGLRDHLNAYRAEIVAGWKIQCKLPPKTKAILPP